MSTEDNMTLVRRFFDEVFNARSAQAAEALLDPGFLAHHPSFPNGIRGPEGIMQMVALFRAGSPDLHYVPDDLLAEGDKVAVRWTAHGTHQGTFMEVPPSGRSVSVTGTDIFRCAGSRLAEPWVNSDLLGLMQQIGAIPAGPAEPPPA